MLHCLLSFLVPSNEARTEGRRGRDLGNHCNRHKIPPLPLGHSPIPQAADFLQSPPTCHPPSPLSFPSSWQLSSLSHEPFFQSVPCVSRSSQDQQREEERVRGWRECHSTHQEFQGDDAAVRGAPDTSKGEREGGKEKDKMKARSRVHLSQ